VGGVGFFDKVFDLSFVYNSVTILQGFVDRVVVFGDCVFSECVEIVVRNEGVGSLVVVVCINVHCCFTFVCSGN
jgi:hypothetical protein